MKEEIYVKKKIIRGSYIGKTAIFRCTITKDQLEINLKNIVDDKGYTYNNTKLDILSTQLRFIINNEYPNWEFGINIKVNENLQLKNGIGMLMMKTMINNVIPKYKEIYGITDNYVETFKLVGYLSKQDFALGNWEKSFPFYLSLMQRLLIDAKYRETYIDTQYDGQRIDMIYHSIIENGKLKVILEPNNMSIETLINQLSNANDKAYINFYFY